MPARNDPVLDSGFPQVDLPRRQRRWFRSSFVWFLPLLLAFSILATIDVDDYLEVLWAAGGLVAASLVAAGLWAWRTRSLSCPRCGQGILRAGLDQQCAYYPCPQCRVMWRSSMERLPSVEDDDLS